MKTPNEDCNNQALLVAQKLWNLLMPTEPTSAHWLYQAWNTDDISKLRNFSIPPVEKKLDQAGCISGAFAVHLARMFRASRTDNLNSLVENTLTGVIFLAKDEQQAYWDYQPNWRSNSLLPIPTLTLKLMRLNFTSLLLSSWPIFSLVGLLGQILGHAHLGMTCDEPMMPGSVGLDVMASATPRYMAPWFEICGGLSRVESLLTWANRQAAWRMPWQEYVRLAETILKGLMLRHQTGWVIKISSHLVTNSNPWVLLHRLQRVVHSELQEIRHHHCCH